jgi:hypothetical protein
MILPKLIKLCDSCQIAKSKKLSFSDSHRISTHPLELIHSDVWTSPILSLGGCKYYVIFIDDHSRFTWLYPLRNKSDVLPCFVKFKNLVENLFSSSIFQLIMEENMSQLHSKPSPPLMASYTDSPVHIPLNKMISLKGSTDISHKLP